MSAHEQDRLSAYLDGELPPEAAAQVAAHLQRCQECRQELELLRLADEAAAALPAEAPVGYFEGFAGRVSARIADEARRAPSPMQPRRGRARLAPTWSWALAAALLLAVVTPLTLRQLERPRGAELPEPVASPVPQAKADAVREAETTPSEASSEASAPAAVPAAPVRRQRSEPPSGSADAARAPVRTPRAEPPARGGAEHGSVPAEPAPPVLADVGSEVPREAIAGEATAGMQAGVPGSVVSAGAERREDLTVRDKAADAPETPFAAPAEPLSASAAGRTSGGAARKPLGRASTALGARPAALGTYQQERFGALAARRPGSLDEWRRLRDDWLAFGRLLGAGSELGDEASVRGIAAALEAVRASAAADDVAAFREAARAYLASPHARQKPRVQALLAAAPTSPR